MNAANATNAARNHAHQPVSTGITAVGANTAVTVQAADRGPVTYVVELV